MPPEPFGRGLALARPEGIDRKESATRKAALRAERSVADLFCDPAGNRRRSFDMKFDPPQKDDGALG
jgi:hypothetical protein